MTYDGRPYEVDTVLTVFSNAEARETHTVNARSTEEAVEQAILNVKHRIEPFLRYIKCYDENNYEIQILQCQAKNIETFDYDYTFQDEGSKQIQIVIPNYMKRNTNEYDEFVREKMTKAVRDQYPSENCDYKIEIDNYEVV